MNNLPRQVLCKIVSTYGQDICNDPRRVRGLLNDLCGGSIEINYLLMALDEHVPAELLKFVRAVPYELLLARLISNLCTNRGMRDDIAHWAVDTWALALGIITQGIPYTGAQMSFKVPPQSVATPLTGPESAIVRQVIIVAPSGGHYTTISAALKNAAPDALIRVRPGAYREGFIIDKPVTIQGDGPREKIIVESSDSSCILMQTSDEACVQGLTLRCSVRSSNQKKHAVDIPMGRLKLVNCDVTSDTLACVAIAGMSTHPLIQACLLHDAGGSGLLIERHAQATIEKCYIFSNSFPNISIRQFANPLIISCKIYGGKTHGILIWENGIGTIEDCEIYGNAYDGIKVRDSCTPIVRACYIYKNAQQEEWVYQKGMGNSRLPRPAEAVSSNTSIDLQRGGFEKYNEVTSGYLKNTSEDIVSLEEARYQKEQAVKRELALKREIALMKELVLKKENEYQEEIARYREIARQKELAYQQELTNQQARGHQQEQELARQKELARQWEQELACQKALVHQREQELAQQKALARQQELTYQQEIARHQQIARQQALMYQQALARQQELARELELVREATKKQSFFGVVLHSIRSNKEK